MVQADKPRTQSFQAGYIRLYGFLSPENEAGDIVVTEFVMVLTCAFMKAEKLHILSS